MFEEYPDAGPFLAAIRETPDDLTLRLVFSDWLEDRGDPRAAWLRDEAIWRWMSPDVHDPIPCLLAELATKDWPRWNLASTVLQRIGSPATGAVRQWLRDNGSPISPVTLLRALRPVPLRPVAELRALLGHRQRPERWLAILDLGHHGPAAAPAVGELVLMLEQKTYLQVDGQLEMEICHTLGRIGSAAREAFPALLGVLGDDEGVSREAAKALAQLLPSCYELVLEHPSWRELLRGFLLGESGVHGVAADAARMYRQRPSAAVAALEALIQGLRQPSNGDRHEVRYELARTLQTLGDAGRAAVPALRFVLAEYDLFVPTGGYAEAAREAMRAALAILDND
jgi:uncharacterized protein (TIGR02996 family)